MVLTFDGKGIVMRREALRDATRAAADKARPKMRSRKAKGEKKNRKRMAQVAAVYTVELYQRSPEEVVTALFREHKGRSSSKRPRPECNRVWASGECHEEAD